MTDETITTYLGKLAERTAAPAGGATAALNAAQAAALLAMTARYCADSAAGHAEDAADVIAGADALRDTCAALMAADGEAYGFVMAAYRLPKTTGEERAARARAIAGALVAAAAPPAEVIASAARLLEFAEVLEPAASRSVAPDLAAAVEAIRAAVATSRTNLEANLSGITDPSARDRLTRVVAGATALDAKATQVIAAVRARYA